MRAITILLSVAGFTLACDIGAPSAEQIQCERDCSEWLQGWTGEMCERCDGTPSCQCFDPGWYAAGEGDPCQGIRWLHGCADRP